MLLGRIIGDTVSTIKEPCYAGLKMLWVQPIDPDGKDRGEPVLSFDAIGAGAGERVLVLFEGGGAQEMCGAKTPSPIGSAIVAIVDEVTPS